jgi:ATP-dependent protease ClpP protease subunit
VPYHVAKSSQCPDSKPWACVKTGDGKVMGCHATKQDAEKQMAALYANEPAAMTSYAQLQGGRAQLRLPLSPVKADRALKALENWREPDAEGRERTWYKIGNAADGPTQVNIFDEISWFGISAQDFVDDLSSVKGDLEIHINSPGGDAFDGITIYNALANRPGVTTVVDGLAASAASIIAQAGQTRIMSPGSMMMIHDALALCIGNEADMLETAKLLGKVSDNIATVYAAHSDTPAADWRKAMIAEGWYTAGEAVDAGLADRLAERPGNGQAVAAEFDRSLFTRWTGQVTGASVDESAWDASKAWAAGAASDDPAAFYNAICAGKKAGDPATQAAHALPHHYHPGDPPNRRGVSAALGRLPGTQGLTNAGAARSHLEAHQSAMGSGSDGGSSNHHDVAPAWGFTDEEFENIRAALKGARK